MRVIFLAALILSASIVMDAQTGAEVMRVDLKECIRIGLQRNFDIQQTYASSTAAAAGLTQAFGQYLPGIRLNANYNRQLTNLNEQISIVNGVPIRGEPLPNTYGINLNAGWTIFNGFAREADYDAAKSNVDAAENDITFQRMRVAYLITRQYLEVLRTERIVVARREQLSLSRATYDRVKALYDNGRAPITQLLSQETEVANQETEVVRAENAHDLAKVDLLTLMCVDPTQPVEVDFGAFPSDASSQQIDVFRAQIGTEAQSVERALKSRPDIRSAYDRAKAAESSVTSAASTYYPTLNATGGYVWRNFEIRDFDAQGQWFVGLNFSVPIFDQFQTNRNIQNAKLAHTQRTIEVERLEQQIGQGVRSAYLQLAAAEKGLDISDRALKSARTSFDAMQERFNVGGAQLVELQQANYQLTTATINRVTAVYAYLDARTFVEFATGLFGEI